MTHILTQTDRDFILKQLTLAPDNILVMAFNHWHELRKQTLVARDRVVAWSDDDTGEESEAVAPAPVERTVERKNVSPGKPLIGKIGTDTKEGILNTLKQGEQPAKKYAEHCKLLWARGEIKFDGQGYYL